MSPSLPQILLIILVIILLFGAGRIPRVMGDMAKGIKSFRQGLTDSDETEEAPKQVTAKKKTAKKSTQKSSKSKKKS